MIIPDYWRNFSDRPENPLIGPPGCEWLLGDPTVLSPDQTPEGDWRLFANTLRGIHQYKSPDGINFEKIGPPMFGGLRACIRQEGGDYYIFYERYLSIRGSVVSVRKSSDLKSWSEPTDLLRPEFAWEGRFPGCNGNPCLLVGDFGYRLYYSASWIFLPDCLFIEPKYIGLAEADNIMGPYRKMRDPIISPDPKNPYLNFGAGAIKVFHEGSGFVGLNNGIYKDELGRTHSAVLLLSSTDGVNFKQESSRPILQPEENTWKHSHVYALDVAHYGGKLWLFYNARDGWFIGTERIGLATSDVIVEV